MRSLLFDARLLRPTPTGIGQYIASLIPELLMVAPDIHIHLLRPPDVYAGYGVEQWNFPNLSHHIRPWRHMSIAQHWLVPRLARHLGADLIHYPHFDAPVWLPSPPVVATIYDAKHLVHQHLFPSLNRAKRAYMRLAYGATLKRARRVITISHSTANDLRSLFNLSPHDIKVIYLAADASLTAADPGLVNAFRSRYDLVRPYILSVGELRPHKNYRTLIRAYAISVAERTHDLVIIGRAHHDGDKEQLKEIAKETGVTDRVHVLEDVDQPGLRSAYTGAQVFALVSLYEGFGLPLLEAMACGVPVVGSNTTAAGEILGEGGVAVAPTEPAAIAGAIDALLNDTAYYREVQARGAARQKEFSWRKTALQTSDVYRSALE